MFLSGLQIHIDNNKRLSDNMCIETRRFNRGCDYMRIMELIRGLQTLDRAGVYVLSKRDIEKMFPDENEKSMEKSLRRMVSDGLLVRVCKGLYLNPAAASKNGRVIETIALALRPGSYSYVSLESMLSEYGVISQVPVGRITVMTTGAKGTYETPFGTIEFTHTKRSPSAVLDRSMRMEGRPLRVAKKSAAVGDLLRVGRNTNMIDEEALDEYLTGTARKSNVHAGGGERTNGAAGGRTSSEPDLAAPVSGADRKSWKLGLSATYDWSNRNIPDASLIDKVLERHVFTDVAKICAHYGIGKVKNVFLERQSKSHAAETLDRMLANIERGLERANSEQEPCND